MKYKKVFEHICTKCKNDRLLEGMTVGTTLLGRVVGIPPGNSWRNALPDLSNVRIEIPENLQKEAVAHGFEVITGKIDTDTWYLRLLVDASNLGYTQYREKWLDTQDGIAWLEARCTKMF